jgi:hypothetical protein
MTCDAHDPKALAYERTISTESNANDEQFEFAPFRKFMSPDALCLCMQCDHSRCAQSADKDK